MKKWYYISLFLFFAAVRHEAQDTIRITLTEAVELGSSRSVDVMVAKNEYISAYWDYRTYKTELLPEVTFKGTALTIRTLRPCTRKRTAATTT